MKTYQLELYLASLERICRCFLIAVCSSVAFFSVIAGQRTSCYARPAPVFIPTHATTRKHAL